MKISGYNKDFRLNEKSNHKDSSGIQCICPPINSHLNISLLSSISACDEHMIWITKDGQGFAVGNNKDGRILGTHKKKLIKKEEMIQTYFSCLWPLLHSIPFF